MVRTALIGGTVAACALFLPGDGMAASKAEVRRTVVQEALRYEVPVSLALAVAKMESGFKGDALSSKGARGVMQIMPATARGEFGITDPDRLWNHRLNVQVGVAFLHQLHGSYGGRWDLALSHYNGGTVKGDSPTSYTKSYVVGVLAWQKRFTRNGCDRLTAADLTTNSSALSGCLEEQPAAGVQTVALRIEPQSLSEAEAQAAADAAMPDTWTAPPESDAQASVPEDDMILAAPQAAAPAPVIAAPTSPPVANMPVVVTPYAPPPRRYDVRRQGYAAFAYVPRRGGWGGRRGGRRW